MTSTVMTFKAGNYGVEYTPQTGAVVVSKGLRIVYEGRIAMWCGQDVVERYVAGLVL